ncbi:hypothetical protein CTI12_AA335930 [Artemisia annua]|uniref:Uncharacterized protein n=1 Tax=Artemisia annua TaxID=35608 RepID=A0A2U1MM29_ARTAN|nr:hypothetical protein CTI12_AA335930 [Artemisia annua]
MGFAANSAPRITHLGSLKPVEMEKLSPVATTSHQAKKPRLNIKPSKEVLLIDLTLDDDEDINTPLNSNSTASLSTPLALSKTISTRQTSSSSSTIRATTLSLAPNPP